jgi:hypothetical protein
MYGCTACRVFNLESLSMIAEDPPEFKVGERVDYYVGAEDGFV